MDTAIPFIAADPVRQFSVFIESRVGRLYDLTMRLRRECPTSPAPRVSTMSSDALRVVIVTGVSGAGKSTALKALEDVGYFCVDNLPLPLLPNLVDLMIAEGARTSTSPQIALGVDAREDEFLDGYRSAFADLRQRGCPPEVLFLDANDDTLVRRFSETRRRHPLAKRRAGAASAG